MELQRSLPVGWGLALAGWGVIGLLPRGSAATPSRSLLRHSLRTLQDVRAGGNSWCTAWSWVREIFCGSLERALFANPFMYSMHKCSMYSTTIVCTVESILYTHRSCTVQYFVEGNDTCTFEQKEERLLHFRKEISNFFNEFVQQLSSCSFGRIQTPVVALIELQLKCTLSFISKSYSRKNFWTLQQNIWALYKYSTELYSTG